MRFVLFLSTYGMVHFINKIGQYRRCIMNSAISPSCRKFKHKLKKKTINNDQLITLLCNKCQWMPATEIDGRRIVSLFLSVFNRCTYFIEKILSIR